MIRIVEVHDVLIRLETKDTIFVAYVIDYNEEKAVKVVGNRREIRALIKTLTEIETQLDS